MLFAEAKFANGVILLSDSLGVHKQLHFPHSPYQMVKQCWTPLCIYTCIYVCVMYAYELCVCVYVAPFGYS